MKEIAKAMIEGIPRLHLAHLPTPLEEAPRLANHLGLSKLLIRRDDQTGLAGGGNKARKLEYDFAEIIDKQCDVVVTVGGEQSNHARMTAAAAQKLGIDVKVVLGGPDVNQYQGNMLLDILFGAEIRFLTRNYTNDDLATEMNRWVEELERSGKRPYAIPIGGSTGLGALGYVRAMQELAGQFGNDPVQIVVATGSCGTLAGTLLGTFLFMPQARVVGISVSRTSAEIATRTARIVKESAQILRLDRFPDETNVESYDGYFQEYGAFTESAKEAILVCARTEGILLDPVYTGKAMAGLIDLAKKRILDSKIPIIFLHTGGTPILFAYEEYFRPLAQILRR